MEPIRLTIPERNEVLDPRIETRPVELRRFLEQLPYSDPIKTCDLVSKELGALNRQRLPPQMRLPLAELYRKTFRKLLQLESRLLRGSIAVRQSRKATESLDALRRLARELAFAFKIIVNDRMLEGAPKPQDRILHTAILRAIKYLGLEQLFSFHIYAPASNHIWRELNQLYALARDTRLADNPYIDDENSALPSSSISHVYKQIALTARADPYHLGNGEAWKVYDFLDRCAELAKVTHAAVSSRRNGLFAVDLTSDKAPIPLTEKTINADADSALVLDTHDLAQWIDTRIREFEVGNLAVAEEIHLALPAHEIQRILRYLLLAWWHCPSRQHARRERLSWVEGVCGLNAAHQLFIEQANVLPETEVNSDDSIEISTSGALRRQSGASSRQERWRLVNHSTGGVALGVQLPCNPALRVGQLIMFHNPTGDAGHWLIGIIRWLTQEQESEIRAGVQYLSDNACPVTLRSQGESNRQVNALMVEVRQSQSPVPPQLVVPHGFYQPELETSIREQGGQRTRIRASKLIEATSSLDRFYFERLDG